MKYSRCDWCGAYMDLGTEYMLVNDGDKCCMDCWNNFGIKDMCDLHEDDYVVVED